MEIRAQTPPRTSSPRARARSFAAGALRVAALCVACSGAPADSGAPEQEERARAASVVACAEDATGAPPRRGLWVLAEGTHRTLDAPGRVDALVERASRLGVTDLFVQVHRSGRSWFPSTRADPTPFQEIQVRTGEDTLGRLVERAHESDVRVHAWFNVFSLALNPDAPIVRQLGRDAVLVDREGRSLLDYPEFEVPEPDRAQLRMDTPALWLDPAVPSVRDYLEATLAELIEAAPGLDGLHLDFIRYPYALPIVPGSRFPVGLDFGYGSVSRARYEAEHEGDFERGDAFDQFRRDQVTEMVRRFGARIPESWELSAAVLSWADRAYIAAMQDWRGWLESDLLDFAVAMTYTLDDRLLRYWSRGLRCGIGGDRIWLGLGTWLFTGAPERAARQIEIAEAVAPRGVALFSYDALADAPRALEALPWWTGP